MSQPMTRRELVAATLGAGAGVLLAPMINRGRYSLGGAVGQEYSGRAVDLVRESVVIDMLGLLTLGQARGGEWMRDPDRFTEADLQRFRDSGITALHPARGVGGPAATESVMLFLSRLNGFAASQDGFMRIDSADDFHRAKASGRVGLVLGVQNSEHFRTVDDVDVFHGLGQRVSQLTYNSRNLIGNGSTERRDDGLSDYGVEVVRRMNEVGMGVDVSHCGDRTTLDAFEASSRPVLITHSNCRALVPGHPRCKTDDAIRRMAATGGVMGITAVRMFVRNEEPTTIEHVLDHFDHVARLVGVEHLGVGSDIDLDGYDDMPEEENRRLRGAYKGSYGFLEKIDVEGLDHPLRMFALTEGLIRRGYGDDDIRGVLGGNFLRVLGEIWRPATTRAPSGASGA